MTFFFGIKNIFFVVLGDSTMQVNGNHYIRVKKKDNHTGSIELIPVVCDNILKCYEAK